MMQFQKLNPSTVHDWNKFIHSGLWMPSSIPAFIKEWNQPPIFWKQHINYRQRQNVSVKKFPLSKVSTRAHICSTFKDVQRTVIKCFKLVHLKEPANIGFEGWCGKVLGKKGLSKWEVGTVKNMQVRKNTSRWISKEDICSVRKKQDGIQKGGIRHHKGFEKEAQML